MRYPRAIWKGDGKSGGSYVNWPYRLVIHTTETAGVPGYGGGKTAPHITYSPASRKFYQHTDFLTAARALRHPFGTPQTNRANTLQLEIVCYSDKRVADQSPSRIWVGELTDGHYQDLADFIGWCGDEFDVKPTWPDKQAFSYSQANATEFRLLDAQWRLFHGVCGHQHVPDNTHWVPGPCS